MTTLKTKIKSVINANKSKAWLDHLKKLVVQGDLLRLSHSEESDLTRRSYIYTLPRRVLSFAINASHDSEFSENTQTVLHVLAGCKTMLEQGRDTWIHNCNPNRLEMCISLRGLTNHATI